MEKRVTLDYASPRPAPGLRSVIEWMTDCWRALSRWLFLRPRVYVVLALIAFVESILWQLKHNPFSFFCSFIAMVTWPVLLVRVLRLRKPKGINWRILVGVFFVLSVGGTFGFNRCPHAAYFVVGDAYWVVDGKECGNPGHSIPFARKIWISLFGESSEYYGWNAG